MKSLVEEFSLKCFDRFSCCCCTVWVELICAKITKGKKNDKDKKEKNLFKLFIDNHYKKIYCCWIAKRFTVWLLHYLPRSSNPTSDPVGSGRLRRSDVIRSDSWSRKHDGSDGWIPIRFQWFPTLGNTPYFLLSESVTTLWNFLAPPKRTFL